MTSYPFWVTPSQLGSYDEGTSLTENQIVLAFGDTADAPVTASLLNGALPPGIQWQQTQNQIQLTGFLRSVTSSENYNWTFRVSNGVQVTDRTFYLEVQNVSLQVFEFETSNVTPLLFVYQPQEYTAQIQVNTQPLSLVSYEITNTNVISQGVVLDQASGELMVDLRWKPNQAYTSGKDLVISNSGLFTCVTSGTSGSIAEPQGSGSYVDSDYPSWQPQRFYSVNSVVHNSQGGVYLCVGQGFSDTMSVSGTGSNIVDGTVRWSYQDQAPVWQRVAANTLLNQTIPVRVTSGSQVIQESYEIVVASTPGSPLWITPSGALPSVFTQQSFTYQLEAVDPDLLSLTWSSTNLPSWLQLNLIGELSGVAPAVEQNTTYTFDVTVSDGITSSTRTFEVSVIENVIELQWSSPEDMGQIKDGGFSSIQIKAVSTRPGAFVTYGLSGGQLPVGLILDTQSGALAGWLEYHAQAKTYMWEITATDETETIVRAFWVEVMPSMLGHHWSLQIPLWGTDAQQWQLSNSDGVVDTTNLYLPDLPGWGRVDQPRISVINGIQALDAQQLRFTIQHYLSNFVIQMQDLIWMKGDDPTYQLLAARVQDSDTVELWKPNTVYTQGERVSNTQGMRYVALNTGESGDSEPMSQNSNISDNNLVWSWDSNVNSVSNKSNPLPWMPYHYYQKGDTVLWQGQLFEATLPGTSAGTGGPVSSSSPISDGSVIWQHIEQSYPYAHANLYSPHCLANIRSTLIQQVGWSTAVGSGASADVNVGFDGKVQDVMITQSGVGYFRSPRVVVRSSQGSGAQFQIYVGVVAVQVVNGGVGWSPGTQFELDLGGESPAQVEIQSVTASGAVTLIQVLHTGKFTQIPSQTLTLGALTGRVLQVRLQAGVISCEVTDPGSGYEPGMLTLNFTGQEYNPQLQTFVENQGIHMSIAFVQSEYANNTRAQSMFNPFASSLWDVRCVLATIQGLEYQGESKMDHNTCTWDSDHTHWVDADPATVVSWDNDETIWDNDQTVWDLAKIVWPNYTNTVFDSNQTIWDYYRTILDQRSPSTSSQYSRTWTWWMGEPWRTGAK
jgi:hypothetical protein